MGSSANCCISHDPPSPDGISPRPVPSPSKATKLLPKEPVTSWSTTSRISRLEDVADLRAIFEEVIEEDKSDEFNRGRIKPMNSSSTLRTVKERLKKRFSRDSALSKRHSRSSIGTSEEEIERRAELRRIRQKRIQEELSNEGIYDDDAKSLSTIEGANSVRENKTRVSGALDDSVVFTTLERQPYVLESGIYHTSPKALSQSSHSPRTQSESDLIDLSNTVIDSVARRPHTYNSPGPSIVGLVPSQPLVYWKPGEGQVPQSPVIQPQRPPSINESSGQSSWRLSFTAENRAEHLRRLSQEHAAPIPANTSLSETGDTLVNRMLGRTGFRSTSQPITPLVTANLDSLASHIQTCTASRDFGGVDGLDDADTAIHLHEMSIHQRLAFRGLQSSCSSPQLSDYRSQKTSSSDGGKIAYNDRLKYLRNTSDSIPLSELIPPTWESVVRVDSPSFPPLDGGIQVSPKRSRRNLLSLVSQKDVENEKKSRDSNIVSTSDTSTSTPPTANASSVSLNLSLSRFSRRPTVDDSSVIASETSSFLRREAELEHVQTRFAGALWGPSKPIISKFKEEFALPLEDVPVQQKPSPFQKLAKFATRNYDGVGESDSLGVPAHRKGFGYSFSASPRNVEKRQSTFEFWSRKAVVSEEGHGKAEVDLKSTPAKRGLSAVQRMTKLVTRSYEGPFDSDNMLSVPDASSGLHRKSSNSVERPPKSSGLEFKFGLGSHLEPSSLGGGVFHDRELSSPAKLLYHSATPLSPNSNSPAAPHAMWEKVLNTRVADRAEEVDSELKLPSAIHPPAKQPPPQVAWRGPRARPQNNKVKQERSDDTENVWMRAMQKSMDGKTKAKKSNTEALNDLDDWEAQLASISSKAKIRTKQMSSRGRPRVREIQPFPESWCRYPSHTREERMLSAGAAEKVETHDFAIKKVDDGTGNVEDYHAEKNRISHFRLGNAEDNLEESGRVGNEDTDKQEKEPTEVGKANSKRFSNPFLPVWNRWRAKNTLAMNEVIDRVIHGAEIVNDAMHMPHVSIGRRESMSLAGKVEFPELELLPLRSPPPQSEVIDEEADDQEAEKKRVEELKKKKIKPVYHARETESSRRGMNDLMDIFSKGPDEPEDMPMPKKKKGKMADPYALGLDDGDDEMNDNKKRTKLIHAARGAESSRGGMNDLMDIFANGPQESGGKKDEMAKRMGKKMRGKKGKARDPYDIDALLLDDDMDGSSDFSDEISTEIVVPSRPQSKLSAVASIESLTIDQRIGIDEMSTENSNVGDEDEDNDQEVSQYSIADPRFYEDCIVSANGVVGGENSSYLGSGAESLVSRSKTRTPKEGHDEEVSQFSIKDPRYYDERIMLPKETTTKGEIEQNTPTQGRGETSDARRQSPTHKETFESLEFPRFSKSEKHRTWNGRDWGRFVEDAKGRKRDASVGSVGSRTTVVSRSTVLGEVERLDSLEKMRNISRERSRSVEPTTGRRGTTGESVVD